MEFPGRSQWTSAACRSVGRSGGPVYATGCESATMTAEVFYLERDAARLAGRWVVYPIAYFAVLAALLRCSRSCCCARSLACAAAALLLPVLLRSLALACRPTLLIPASLRYAAVDVSLSFSGASSHSWRYMSTIVMLLSVSLYVLLVFGHAVTPSSTHPRTVCFGGLLISSAVSLT